MNNTTIARIVGVVALAFVAYHYFDYWGIIAVAGLALVNKI